MLFREFAETCSKLESITGRLEMMDVLAKLFKKSNKEEIGKIIYLLQGQVAPAFKSMDVGIGEKFVERAISIATGYSTNEIEKLYKKTGDLGKTAEELLKKRKQAVLIKKELECKDVHETFVKIAKTSGEGSQEIKIKLLAELISNASPLEAKYIVRIPLGKLQLGVGDATILEALSIAKEGDRSMKEDLERAYNLCSDLGLVAEKYYEKKENIKKFKIQPFNPIRPALAEREPTPEAIIKRLKKCAAEVKLDGFRIAVHKVGDEVMLFSRRLENVTYMFPEIIDAVRKNVKAKEIIFEGEALGYNEDTGEFYPFQYTIQRKRKHGIEKMVEEIPLHLFCFDILYLDGEDLTLKPYIERRKILEKVIKEGKGISLVEMIITDDVKELSDFFDKAIERGMEGLVVKDLNAPYIAGARKFAWIKLKRSYRSELADTIDVVIVGGLKGKGLRSKFKFGALLCAVYDEKEDVFKTIAKVGSGFTEEQMEKIGNLLEKIKISKKHPRVDSLIEPDFWVIPKYVITVAADEITESPLHTAVRKGDKGLALRFPRMVGDIRTDKKPEDATTTKEIEEMFKMQKRVKLE
ncbi:MAG: ATP-dependent DNA ligase [Candidatus Micrarchaeia archaeon]